HRVGPSRRRDVGDGGRTAEGSAEGLLPGADDLREREELLADRAGGNLRAGGFGDPVQRRRRSGEEREGLELRGRRRDVCGGRRWRSGSGCAGAAWGSTTAACR